MGFGPEFPILKKSMARKHKGLSKVRSTEKRQIDRHSQTSTTSLVSPSEFCQASIMRPLSTDLNIGIISYGSFSLPFSSFFFSFLPPCPFICARFAVIRSGHPNGRSTPGQRLVLMSKKTVRMPRHVHNYYHDICLTPQKVPISSATHFTRVPTDFVSQDSTVGVAIATG